MSIPTVDGNVAAGSSTFVGVQPSSVIGLADLEYLPTVDDDAAARCSTPIGVQPSSAVGMADSRSVYRQ